jgi:hypothetical protein
MSTLATEIESFLLRRAIWVATDEICLIFYVDPRELRAQGDKPGLCSEFAISGPHGFRHISTCTNEEWLQFSERIHAHGLSELRRISALRIKREGAVTPRQEVAN